MHYYLDVLGHIDDFLAFFRKNTIDRFFKNEVTGKVSQKTKTSLFCFCPPYQECWESLKGIVEISKMLGIEGLEYYYEDMVSAITWLNTPEEVETLAQFDECVNKIKNVFKDSERKVRHKLRLLNKEERSRLNEALNCYMNNCNYSTVVMAVSAIEHRLLSLMMSKCQDKELEDLTLGQLIRRYLDDKAKYGHVIPTKHLPLLEHCNTYRVFSVHPKKEIVSRATATSIINMTFSFLLDEELKHKTESKKKQQ